MDNGLIFKDESYAIQGAVFEVYREMGCGFLEAVYQECLEKELGVKTETYTMQPLSISQGISQGIAGQFGIAGVLIWSEMEYVKNRFDDSVDEEGIKFYQKSSAILKNSSV